MQTDKDADFGDFNGNPGFSISTMIDLQRVFVCIDMASDDPLRNDDLDYLQMVSKSAHRFSTKVVLPMSASADFRTGIDGFHFSFFGFWFERALELAHPHVTTTDHVPFQFQFK